MSRFPRLVGLTALALVIAAGCGATTSPSAPVGSALPGGASPVGSLAAATAVAASPGASTGPGGIASGDLPTTAPATPVPGTSASGSAPCSGNHDNHVFFDAIAAQVQWDVYCAVLPQGWFVDAGSFQLRGGGHLEITYKGPNGARFTLQEGNVCTQGASACAPHDQMLGSAMFGDLAGNLASVGGGFAVYVNPGEVPAWSALGTGLDQGTFTAFAAALVRVAH
jgi:hypothetical protein